MIVSVRLRQFRSYRDSSFEFEPGVNIIIGANASGKTNLLEAILLLCRGKSYRAKDAELVEYNKSWARIDGLSEHGLQRTVKLENKDGRLQKSFELDGVVKKRLLFEQLVPSVLFEPTQLQSLTTSPTQRRAFVDELLEQTDAEYARLLRNYERTLAQRNSLLKQRPSGIKQQLFVWDLRLSEFGAAVAERRIRLIDELNKSITDSYQSIAGGKQKVALEYQTSIAEKQYASSMLKKLESSLEEDLQRGFTLCGPHRDDFGISLRGQDIQVSASRGEVRSLLLALKLKEAEMIEKARGERPLLLLDDVFGELDGSRRKALTSLLSTHQTFVTTTDADIVAKNFAKNSNLIMLAA